MTLQIFVPRHFYQRWFKSWQTDRLSQSCIAATINIPLLQKWRVLDTVSQTYTFFFLEKFFRICLGGFLHLQNQLLSSLYLSPIKSMKWNSLLFHFKYSLLCNKAWDIHTFPIRSTFLIEFINFINALLFHILWLVRNWLCPCLCLECIWIKWMFIRLRDIFHGIDTFSLATLIYISSIGRGSHTAFFLAFCLRYKSGPYLTQSVKTCSLLGGDELHAPNDTTYISKKNCNLFLYQHFLIHNIFLYMYGLWESWGRNHTGCPHNLLFPSWVCHVDCSLFTVIPCDLSVPYRKRHKGGHSLGEHAHIWRASRENRP